MNATAEKLENAPALMPETEGGQLAVMQEITPEQWPQIYEGGDYLSNVIERVRDEVSREVPDLSTAKGRKRIATLARMVSSTKTAVEDPGRDYLRYLKDMKIKPVEKNLREFVQAMDAIRDAAREPLTQWEAAEKKRIAAHQAKIGSIKAAASNIDGLSSVRLRALLDAVGTEEIGPQWEEFEGEAAAALVITQKTLRDALARREAFEAEQAALEKQRQEQEAERQRLERERIEREAEDRARIAAEAKAKAEQEAAQRREIEARMAQERAEREAEAAKQREAQAKADAAAQAERAAQAAVEAEQKRIAAEEAARLAAEKRRQEDYEHRATINREALADLVAADFDEATAKKALTAIITGKVRHVSISY